MRGGTTVRQDDSGESWDRQATVKTDKVLFFLSRNWGFSSPHYSKGPVLTRNSRGPRQRTKMVNWTRHTKKWSNTFLCPSFMCGVCVRTRSHKTATLISLTFPFWFLVSNAFGTNIYILLAHLLGNQTWRNRSSDIVSCCQGVSICRAGDAFLFLCSIHPVHCMVQ